VERARLASVERGVGRAGSGAPLRPGVRAQLEPALHANLSGVRVHEGSASEGAASDIQARAFTVGNDIYLGKGQSSEDLALMAHEATHTVQQAGPAPTVGRTVQREIDRAEEIERSRISPGLISGTQGPLRFSLYNFVIGEPTLKAEHAAFLADLAGWIVDHPGLLVEVTGHTDSSGTDLVNDPLAIARANEVAGTLALNGAVANSLTGAGARSPAGSNASVVGRSRNRRVDIVVYAPVSVVIPPTGEQDPGRRPETDTPEDEEWFCAQYPLLCGIGGVSLFCLLFPEICSLPLPALCLIFPGLCELDDDDDADDDDDDEELECGDPRLPLSHVEYIPPNGDKGNALEAKPLTLCQGNTTGSPAKRSDPTWPYGWECIAGAGGDEYKFWARAHLLHDGLHGPGNERKNIIISDKSINVQMERQAERQAYTRIWDQHKTIYYRVEVQHLTGDYPRPYFAESVHIEWGEMDPLTGAETSTEFDDTITSGVARQPPPCASTPDTDHDPPPPGPHTTDEPPVYNGPTMGPAPEGALEPMETPLTQDCGRIACRTLDYYRDSVGHFRGDVYIVTADEHIVREMIRLEKAFLLATRFQSDVRLMALLRIQLSPPDYDAARLDLDRRVTQAARLRVFDFLVNGSGDPTWRVGRPEEHAAGGLGR
jgi:outer membrane protein OmpA-like peptidoglycan-associated protein